MSEADRGSQNPAEPASASAPASATTAVKAHTTPQHPSANGSAPTTIHRDLNQIIARAREDIRHLREELTRHEAQITAIVRERDLLQERYTHLYENFIESVHIAAEDEVRQGAQTLETSGKLPRLFEPIQASIIHWADQQQAEREDFLRQKVETLEGQAAVIRQQLLLERAALQAEREKFAQDRQTFHARLKSRETWLHHRWVVKAWGTAGIMFLVLPALQVYLLLQKASGWDLIIIPTIICLTLTAFISILRARRRPAPPKPK